MLNRPFVVALAAVVAAPAPALAAPRDTAAAIRAYLAQCHAAQVCNGAYLVARRGRVIYRGAVGDAGDPARTALTADHAFDIGSISKQFTAMAVLRLSAQGRLALTDPVVRHLPDFPYPEVTIEQLLTHTSGIPEMLGVYGTILRAGGGRSAPITTSDVVTQLAERRLPARTAPGAAFSYNNTGYMVAALVVERASGMPFDAYLARTFFAPLGMRHTRLRLPANEAGIGPRAWGFRPAPDGSRRPNEQLPGFYVRGAGGIYSTVGDLLRWESALTRGRVVPPAMWARATTPVRLNDGRTYPYGYGIKLKPTTAGVARMNHDGDWRGFKANLAHYPGSAVTIVQLTNNSEDDSADVNEEALATLAVGGEVAPVLPPVGRALFGRLGDPAAARAWFAAESAAVPARYAIREEELNALGYRLLEGRDVAKARLVFELAVGAFPRSANALDSLADAQEAAGDLAAARASMRGAVALAPASAEIRAHAARLEAGTPAPR